MPPFSKFKSPTVLQISSLLSFINFDRCCRFQTISKIKQNQNIYIGMRKDISVKKFSISIQAQNELQIKKAKDLFHRFIQISDYKPSEASLFPEFGYMEQSVRKTFKQLNKTSLSKKPSDKFIQFWKELSPEEQVALYFHWVQILEKAEKFDKLTKLPYLCEKEGELYIKMSMFGKWEKKTVTLKGPSFCILSNRKIRELPLQHYEIRKSKNKEHFGWVLETITSASHLKCYHCGTNNVRDYEDWYSVLYENIEIERMRYFKDRIIESLEQKPQETFEKRKASYHEKMGSLFHNNPPTLKEEHKKERHNTQMRKQSEADSDDDPQQKTLTELVISNEIQSLDSENQAYWDGKIVSEDTFGENNPNIFQKLIPNKDVTSFSKIPQSSTLICSEKEYSIYELNDAECNIKMTYVVQFPKSLVFEAITEEVQLWNSQIDIYSVKTMISSENSALIYEKNKSQGFLYRDRDFLYLRHCFSIQATETQPEKTFIIDKSIDSLQHPPFMTVSRGEKELIWCLVENKDNQCMIIVEGHIKGGGYMNQAHNKEMAVKSFKNLPNLGVFLKQKFFNSKKTKSTNNLFREKWVISVAKKSAKRQEREKKIKKDIQQPPLQSVFVSFEQEQEKQFEEFIKQTSHVDLDANQEEYEKRSASDVDLEYVPPKFNEKRQVCIPTEYLQAKHPHNPRPKPVKPNYFPHFRGHHVWKGEWAVANGGGLNYVDEEKMKEQKKVLTFIIKRIGKNILSGKGILNISLPVDIFCRESNIERLAMSFGFGPTYLEKAAAISNPIEQLKYVLSSGITGSLIYLTMEKPFNPILGETFQCWIDDCPVYFQQISHHPPIAAFLMVGRGYTISGTVEAKMDLSINSGQGTNEGIFTVKFDNGNTFHYTTPTGMLQGLTYGQRKLLFVGKSYYWNMKQGLFLELSFNPAAKKKGFFGGGVQNLSEEQKLQDYYEGTLKKYVPEQLEEFLTPKKNDFRKVMAIPKASPTVEPLEEIYKVSGRWTKYMKIGDEKMVNVDEHRYYKAIDEKYPLASNCNFREDIVYRRLNDVVNSQDFKEVLEVKQRKDKKQREDYHRKK